ncbi:TPA: hypothetical protein ACXNPR_001425 [Enterobacter cancerogenus]
MDSVIIELDKRWELQDFAVLTKEYLQLYGVLYAVSIRPEQVARSRERGIDNPQGFATMPWEGGHSVVNFIRSVSSFVPESKRPVVKKIQYASPGFIELSCAIDVAWQIAQLITAVGASVLAANKVYDKVMKDYRQREWSSLKSQELRLKNQQQEIKLIIANTKLLQKSFNLDDVQFANLLSLAGGDELVQLKMLLAMHRRIIPLAELQAEGKANFDTKDAAVKPKNSKAKRPKMN